METVALHPAKPRTAQDSSGDGFQVVANTLITQKVKNPRPAPPPKRRSAPGKHQQTLDAACLPAPSRAQKAPKLRLPRNRQCRASPFLISCIRHILLPSCALRRNPPKSSEILRNPPPKCGFLAVRPSWRRRVTRILAHLYAKGAVLAAVLWPPQQVMGATRCAALSWRVRASF